MFRKNNFFIPIFYFLILVFSCSFSVAHAQKSKKELEKSKKRQELKIKQITAILKETRTEKAASLGYLNALQQKVKAQKKLLSYLNQELKGLDYEISENQKVVNALSQDLENLKQEYALMLYNAQKTSRLKEIYYIFSSKSFRQAIMRLDYLKQYSQSRIKQANAIESVKEELEKQLGKYQSSKREKKTLLYSKTKEAKNLQALERKQSQLIATLSNKQEELNKELEKYKKSLKDLNRLIETTLAENLKKSKNKNSDASTSKSFASKRNHRLSWPVKNSFISRPFGTIPHPVLKGISIQNQGVDIQTPVASLVKSVHDGLVKRIAFIPGAMNNVVIIQHGDYFTVYAKLKSVRIKIGDKVKLGEVIGVVDTDNEGKSELQFQVWKGSKNLNPKKWLKK